MAQQRRDMDAALRERGRDPGIWAAAGFVDHVFGAGKDMPLVPAPLSSQGQALAKARSATSAVNPDGEATVSSHGSAPFRRYPKLAVRGIRTDRPLTRVRRARRGRFPDRGPE